MGSWAIPVYVILGVTGFLILFAWWKYLTTESCPSCYYPVHRCECNHCRHHRQSEVRWSQDGWVSQCRDCTEILYHGDDYDGRP